MGAAFLLPFLWFLWRGYVEPGLRARLWTIFGLGGALGAVGWWMVASGLADRVSVSQYRLAFHLTLACVIYAMVLWTAQRLVARPHVGLPRRTGVGAVVHLLLVLVQIYLGALVAGLRAGLHLQHLAADRRQFHSGCVAAVLQCPVVAEFFRECAHGAVRPSHDGLWVVDGRSRTHLVDVMARGGSGCAYRGAGAHHSRHASGRCSVS